jgi:hypothetical protein
MVITDEQVQEAFDRLRFGAKKAAQAKANRLYLVEFRKTLKSMEMRKHLSQPLAAQEREAYASDEYQAHLLVLKDAIEQDEEFTWQMVRARAVIEAWRTASANQRGEAKIG